MLPDAQLLHAEIIVFGTNDAAGSNATPCQNVFHYRRNSIVNPISKPNLNTVFQANVLTPILAASNARYKPNNVTIRMINDPLDAPQAFAAGGAGAIGTDSEPSDDAVYMLLRTAVRGRSFFGSKHFGGTSEVDTTGDILTGAGLARWVVVKTAIGNNLVDASPNTWTPFVFSRFLSTMGIFALNVVGADVTAVLLDLNIGTMRRRRSRTVR
jgi:hypothetical protein